MTKHTPEAVAFRAKIDAEGPDWPDDLKDAATLLRCELENVPRKGWRATSGPARLAQYSQNFERLYSGWKGKQRVFPDDAGLGEPKMKFEDTFSAEEILLEELAKRSE